MIRAIREQIQTVFQADPAAKSVLEVLFCYPGVHAVRCHRIAPWFYRHGMLFAARFV